MLWLEDDQQLLTLDTDSSGRVIRWRDRLRPERASYLRLRFGRR